MQEQNSNAQPPVPNDSASFGIIPKGSESFGSLPNDSENFRTVPNASERKENHTLTVREVARMFEAAGVARTERSITNWCQPNRSGIARLDAYFDPNERRYFITPQSAEVAIQEEKARVAKVGRPSEPPGSVRKDAEVLETTEPVIPDVDSRRVKLLEQEVMDLKITNKGKDYFIEQLQKERDGHIQQLLTSSHRIGELETKLLRLESPKNSSGEGQM